MAAAVIKGSPVTVGGGRWPGTLGGQLWDEGTIEPPSHGSPAIQSAGAWLRSRAASTSESRGVTARRGQRPRSGSGTGWVT
jgi:hypothetical protein